MALVAGCGNQTAERPESIKLIAHDSFKAGVTDETFAGFTEETGVEVEVIAAGDAGALVNQAVLTKDNPLADVLFGVDDTFLSRALDEGIFSPFQATDSDKIEPDLTGGGGEVTPIDFGDVCINLDNEWFADAGIDPPESLDTLRDPAYASLLTVEHPATSSPGLAFLLATIDRYGEDGWLDFWADLHQGGTRVAADWDTAYYTEFTRYGGDTPMVVSYASSPPAEVIFAEEPLDAAPTSVLTDGCYRQIEYAGVLEGTEHPELAGDLIDYMLTVEFQETIPLTWFVFPANMDASLPDVFREYTVVPDMPTRFETARIAEGRERWIDQWIAVMER
jgi:thiamine transport system substrate-binding protein